MDRIKDFGYMVALVVQCLCLMTVDHEYRRRVRILSQMKKQGYDITLMSEYLNKWIDQRYPHHL